jgi:tetratricopeptide (TPR) repeat protein
MNNRKLLIGSALVVLGAAAAWWGWHWHTTPVPPHVALEGVDEEMADLVRQGLDEVRRQPRSAESWGKLGMILAANSFDEPAAVCFVHAERFDPRSPRWPALHGIVLLGRDGPAGILLLKQALALRPGPADRAAILSRLAHVLVEDGQLDDAEARVNELRSLEGDSGRVHFGLALVARARDDRAGAREHLNLLTDDPYARKQALTLLASLSRDDPALWQQASQLPPDLNWPSPFEDDMRSFKVDRMKRIAQYWDLSRQGRQDEAFDFLQRLAAQAPDEGICFILGFELYKANRFDEAADALQTALRFNVGNVKAQLFLGAALLQRGEKLLRDGRDSEAALDLFRQAIACEDRTLKLQSDSGQAHLIRGRALKYLGRTEEATQALRQALLYQPEFAEIHLTLGELLAEAGQLDEGLAHLENAVRVAGPDSTRPRAALDAWRAKAKKKEAGR